MADSPAHMALTLPRREESLGLVIAVVAHLALVALIVLRPASVAVIAPPERMTVTLSEDAAPVSTAPMQQVALAPAAAPMLAPQPAEAWPQPQPLPVAQPRPVPLPKVQPRTQPNVEPQIQPRPQPRIVPAPAPRPAARVPLPKPNAAPKPSAGPASKALTKPAPQPAAKPLTASRMIAFRNLQPPGASRLSNDFLKGVAGAKPAPGAKPAAQSAATIGPAVQAALSGAISRQLKPRWSAPQGVEVDQLVTILSWRLNPDGSLAGSPQLVRQEGLSEANRPQAARHAEQAIRAVQLAAPFALPPEYYDAWKRVVSFRFDRRLSQ